MDNIAKQPIPPGSPISTDYVHVSTTDCSHLNFPKVKSSYVLKEGGERYFSLLLSNNVEIQRTLAQFNTLHAYLSYRYPKSKLPAEVPYRSWSNYIGSITETINNNYVPESVHTLYNNATLTFNNFNSGNNNNNNSEANDGDEDGSDNDAINKHSNSSIDTNKDTTIDTAGAEQPTNKEEEYITYIEAAISSYIASIFSIPEAWTCKKTIEFFQPGEYISKSSTEMTLTESSRQLVSAETFLLQAVPRSMVELASKGVFELDIRVKTKRDIIIWDFSVLEHDIAFTVYFEDENVHANNKGTSSTSDKNDNQALDGEITMNGKKVKKRKPRLSFFQSSGWGSSSSSSKKTNLPPSDNANDDSSSNNKSIQEIVDEKCSVTDKSTWLQVYPYTHYTMDECCPPLSVQGRFHPGRPGTCRLEWDNSFSMIRSKTLRYVVEVVSKEAMTAATLAADDKAILDEQLKREKKHADEVNEAMNISAGTNFLNDHSNDNGNNSGIVRSVPTHLSSESVLVERLEKMEDVIAKMTALRDQALAKAQIEETQRKETDVILIETQRRLQEVEEMLEKQKIEISDTDEKCKKWEALAKEEVGNSEEHRGKLEEIKTQLDVSENECLRLRTLSEKLQGELEKVNGVALINENETLKSELKDLRKELKQQVSLLGDEKHENESKNSEIVQLKASVQMLKSEMRSQKAIVDGDLLKYKSTNQKLMDEIEKFKAKESKLKAQKTLLVREVKSLRNKLNNGNNDAKKAVDSNSGDDDKPKASSSNNNMDGKIPVRGWS